VGTADQRDSAEMLRRLLDAVDRGELTADTPAERRNLRRLEGMLAALEARRPRGDGRVVRLVDGEAGLSARTIERRIATVSGLFGYLVMIGEAASNPVPRGLSTRRRGRPKRGAAVRVPRTLPGQLPRRRTTAGGELGAGVRGVERLASRSTVERRRPR
jgi:hypothetical protein